MGKTMRRVLVTLLTFILAITSASMNGVARADSLRGQAVTFTGNTVIGSPIGTVNGFEVSPVLFGMEIGGKPFGGYCIEYYVPIDDQQVAGMGTSRLQGWDQFPGENNLSNSNPGANKARQQVSWLVLNSYPNVALEQLAAKYNAIGLTQEEAVTATQAAIWTISDNFNLDPSLDLSQRVFDVYDGLLKDTANATPEELESVQSAIILTPPLVDDRGTYNHQQTVIAADREIKITPASMNTTAGWNNPWSHLGVNSTADEIAAATQKVEKTVEADQTDDVYDLVHLDHIMAGADYTLEGSLRRHAAPEEVLGTGSTKVNTDELIGLTRNGDGSVSGYAVVKISGGKKLQGEPGVVFETLKVGDQVVLNHADPSDRDQIVHAPEKPKQERYMLTPGLRTHAAWNDAWSTLTADSDASQVNEATRGAVKTVDEGAQQTIHDLVFVDNIHAEAEYQLKASARSTTDTEKVLGTGSKTFTSVDMLAKTHHQNGSVSGYVVVDIPLQEKLAMNQSAVVFEDLVSSEVNAQGNPSAEGENLIARHADASDRDQMVHVSEKPAEVPGGSTPWMSSIVPLIPLIGAIPVLGYLFGHSGSSNSNESHSSSSNNQNNSSSKKEQGGTSSKVNQPQPENSGSGRQTIKSVPSGSLTAGQNVPAYIG
ncbi:hypothetical protein GCM10028828_09560 [Corynebacterium tapiri]